MITKINCNVIKVINILKNNGFEAYLVGGAVRDLLLNHKINDYDITTNAYPEIIKKLFNDYKIYDIGEKFGTIGVCIDDEIIEITTYRYDVNYIKHRKPNEVLFGCSLEEDLKRRDFTINAIAYDPIDNKMIDYYAKPCYNTGKIFPTKLQGGNTQWITANYKMAVTFAVLRWKASKVSTSI